MTIRIYIALSPSIPLFPLPYNVNHNLCKSSSRKVYHQKRKKIKKYKKEEEWKKIFHQFSPFSLCVSAITFITEIESNLKMNFHAIHGRDCSRGFRKGIPLNISLFSSFFFVHLALILKTEIFHARTHMQGPDDVYPLHNNVLMENSNPCWPHRCHSMQFFDKFSHEPTRQK